MRPVPNPFLFICDRVAFIYKRAYLLKVDAAVKQDRDPVASADMIASQIAFLPDKQIDKERIVELKVYDIDTPGAFKPELFSRNVHYQRKPFFAALVSEDAIRREVHKRAIRLNAVIVPDILKDLISDYHDRFTE